MLLDECQNSLEARRSKELTEAEARLVFFATGANMGQALLDLREEDPFATPLSINPSLRNVNFELWCPRASC